MTKYVYEFGPRKTDGNAKQKSLLGGKGANLAEMAKIKLPVPAGFTISTECCNDFFSLGKEFPNSLGKKINHAMANIEKEMGMKFGDKEKPLLVSCRSGARDSMPGMMETILNVGLCSKTIPGMIQNTGNEWFVYDAYRRLIMMYSSVVMEKAEQSEPKEGIGIRLQLEKMMTDLKRDKNYPNDTDISTEDMKLLCEIFKQRVKETLKKEFPDNPQEQLLGSIGAVFKSWNGKRAVSYRKIENIPDEWGTAVNVQSMVFGNMGDDSGTGVAFTRNPATGDNKFYGEWLTNAQGEDVVAGVRTPNPLNKATKTPQNEHLDSLEEAMPELYSQLSDIRNKLENHYKEMQDIEFTIQKGKLYILQCRTGKRNASAALKIAMDMHDAGMIDEKTMICRLNPKYLDEILHPVVDPKGEKKAVKIAEGLPAGPGGAFGQIVFTAEDAVQWFKEGKTVILVREETSPEDIEGMRAASAILTARGGMTSHAALVARGWGKCCIVGAGSLKINFKEKHVLVGSKKFKEGDFITLNGTKGVVYEGRLKMKSASENLKFKEFIKTADKYRTMKIRTNADTPEDAITALNFGAEGIGLFRTEHMFYGSHSEKPLFLMRKMILSKSKEERKTALDELFPFVKKEIQSTLEVMDGKPVTIRLLDPPLHEFIPRSAKNQESIAKALKIDIEEIIKRGNLLKESNPMLGHRGVRLSITFPEITEMQVRAIFDACAELIERGRNPLPEIMVPFVFNEKELLLTKKIVLSCYEKTIAKYEIDSINYMFGTMIEIPGAALIGDKIAEHAEFFSFGTNDLTQMSFGFSRDDMGSFIGEYLDSGTLQSDPFETLAQESVGRLIEVSVEKGRKTRPDIKLGICGEHGGEPTSIAFFYKAGLSYVSCSPYRVPIARLAAAQAAILDSDRE